MTEDRFTKLATFAMATRFEIVLGGDDPVRLHAAGEEAINEIERLDRQLSRFRPESDVSWINAHAAEGPVRVEPELFGLLRRAREIWEATEGAFDITVAPLMRAWGFTDGEGRVPSGDELAEARKVVGMEHVILDERASTVSFDRPGVEIDLGAIGKGYAIEQAVECLRELGVAGGVVQGGTSTAQAFGNGKLEFGIATPRAEGADDISKFQIPNSNCKDSALSVSAVHGRAFTKGGREYGHVIDPRTGEPVSHTRMAAVWGPSPTNCDALSTALLVLGEEWLPTLARKLPGYDGLTRG